MAQSHEEWVQAIARHASAEVETVKSVLATHHIQAAPVLAPPRHIEIVDIEFSGVKDGVNHSGPFAFHWNDLRCGVWAIVTDQNLRGKSSILEVCRWLFRGRHGLQDDVRKWIHHAKICFRIDGVIYKVTVRADGGLTGTLEQHGRTPKKSVILAEFGNDDEFENAMEDFFLRKLEMDLIATWRKSTDQDGLGRIVTHGWPAFSGAMFIGTNYDVLLGDVPPMAGINSHLIQMYLGLPWVSTLAAAKTAEKSVQGFVEREQRRREQGRDVRKRRIDDLQAELEAKHRELACLPDDRSVNEELSRLSTSLAELRREERRLDERLQGEEEALRHAQAAHQEDRRDLQVYLDSVAAGTALRMLDPSLCPRCDHPIGKARKQKEQETHACSICGELLAADLNAQILKADIEGRVAASEAALTMATNNEKVAQRELENCQDKIRLAETEIYQNTDLLGSFAERQDLLRSIAVLEGRLQEASSDPDPDEDDRKNDLKILKAIVEETSQRVRALQDEVLDDVSKRIVEYANRFGMQNLSAAKLTGNGALALFKGGVRTSYSNTTKGEQLRLKVATVLAMMEVAETRGYGRHPGLLMVDSPGAQEVSVGDLDCLVAGLQSISGRISHLQVFIASTASAAILDHVPRENRREALAGGFLW